MEWFQFHSQQSREDGNGGTNFSEKKKPKKNNHLKLKNEKREHIRTDGATSAVLLCPKWQGTCSLLRLLHQSVIRRRMKGRAEKSGGVR